MSFESNHVHYTLATVELGSPIASFKCTKVGRITLKLCIPSVTTFFFCASLVEMKQDFYRCNSVCKLNMCNGCVSTWVCSFEL